MPVVMLPWVVLQYFHNRRERLWGRHSVPCETMSPGASPCLAQSLQLGDVAGRLHGPRATAQPQPEASGSDPLSEDAHLELLVLICAEEHDDEAPAGTHPCQHSGPHLKLLPLPPALLRLPGGSSFQ